MRSVSKSLRVIQVSDCHLAADSATDYRGQSADRNLASLLPALRRRQPDLLLLTGDVSEDGSAASYGRVAAMLGSIGAPVLALPGNHDDNEVMRRYFPLGPWDRPYARSARGWQLILLDSTEAGRVSGVVSAESLSWLRAQLERSQASNVLIALHHQPVPVNGPWIDRYGLENAEDLFGVLDSDPRVRCICWGHVHQDFRTERGETLLLGSPSTVANSLPKSEKFTLDLVGPSYRWLELASDGSVETGCSGVR